MSDFEYSFARYLAAKKSVDDRALNRLTWDALRDELDGRHFEKPIRVLEVGAGIGTMLQRMVEWKLLANADYTAVDRDPQNLSSARQRLSAWAEHAHASPPEVLLRKGDARISWEMEVVDIHEFAHRHAGKRTWDLLVAHAVLDLLDIPSCLPQLFNLLSNTGLFYFTINFDGLTVFEPALDPEFDNLVMCLYHDSMDQRRIDAEIAGDSLTGRHLFHNLQRAGAHIIEAGSSDWIVFAQQGTYPADEAYFLHFIIYTIQTALAGHPDLNERQFTRWIAARHTQVERGELVYIAHQIDVLGRYPE